METPTLEAAMRRALLLAKQGEGRVEPNPMVGAVVLDRAGQIVGEGWHEQFGGPHAEVHALRVAGDAARDGTLIVTLEPCCHTGKTPPCVDAVTRAGVKRVVISVTDPARHGAGSGVEQLRKAGLEVTTGLLEGDGAALIAPFRKRVVDRKPWVIAKWAMTLDGKIAARTGDSRWVSSEPSRDIVHRLRGRMDAVLVGIGTALADDPLLTARGLGPRTPARIVIDPNARLPASSRLARSLDAGPVIVVVSETAPAKRLHELTSAGVEVTTAPTNHLLEFDWSRLLTQFANRDWTNLLIEGGSGVLGGLFDAREVDEVHVFIAPKLVGGAEAPSPLGGRGLSRMADCALLNQPHIVTVGDDQYWTSRIAWPAA